MIELDFFVLAVEKSEKEFISHFLNMDEVMKSNSLNFTHIVV